MQILWLPYLYFKNSLKHKGLQLQDKISVRFSCVLCGNQCPLYNIIATHI